CDARTALEPGNNRSTATRYRRSGASRASQPQPQLQGVNRGNSHSARPAKPRAPCIPRIPFHRGRNSLLDTAAGSCEASAPPAPARHGKPSRSTVRPSQTCCGRARHQVSLATAMCVLPAAYRWPRWFAWPELIGEWTPHETRRGCCGGTRQPHAPLSLAGRIRSGRRYPRLPAADRCCEPAQFSCGFLNAYVVFPHVIENLAVGGIDHAGLVGNVVEHLFQIGPEPKLFELPGMAIQMPDAPLVQDLSEELLPHLDPAPARQVILEVSAYSRQVPALTEVF